MRELFTSKTCCSARPTDSWDPSAFIQGLCAIQWCGMWAMPGDPEGARRRLRHLPLPARSADTGKQSVYNGGWSMFVNAKAKNVDAAKEYVKWLWIDQKKYQEDWATSYGFHIPPRTSLAAVGRPS